MTTYLDAAATTPVRREVLEAMWPYLTTTYGNPSSHHEVGEAAARGLEAARRAVAATGVDVISVGALTHSVRALDLGLDVVVEQGR